VELQSFIANAALLVLGAGTVTLLLMSFSRKRE
jgi:hypothetical protein